MKVEIRADGKSMHISGYVNAVARDSRPIMTLRGKCVEQIKPGVFADAIKRADDIELRLNHKEGKYASTADGTLELHEDNIGLRAECDVTDPELIARADRLKGWSFGAYMTNDEMEERSNDIPRRHITEMDLFEVSLIDDRMNPCYTGTLVETRADGAEAVLEERAFEDDAKIITEKTPVDYSNYENILKTLERAE